MKSPGKLLFIVLAVSPALMGADCIEYDPRVAGLAGSAADAAPPPAGAFVPGKACAAEKTATLKISDYKFIIDCGCRETSGKVCTIPAGTKITWQFADTTEHNVASSMSLFGASGEKLTGDWDAIFASPGSYRYSCSIHPADMSGYRIDVVAAQ